MGNVSTLMGGGRENEAESWLLVQQWALGQQCGTSRRENVLDTAVALRRPGDWTPDTSARFEVYFEKARGFSGPGAKPFVAGLDGGVWTVADLEDAEGARVLQMACDGMTVREIADEMGTSKSTVGRMLTRARRRRPCWPDAGASSRPGP